MDTNGYPFEGVNHLLSVQMPKIIHSKHSTNCCDIQLNGFCICSPTRSVHLENCDIRLNSLTSVLFIHWKGENCTRSFFTDIQSSGQNVTIHIYVTKSWDKQLTLD